MDVIKKHLGICTPEWVVDKVKLIIAEERKMLLYPLRGIEYKGSFSEDTNLPTAPTAHRFTIDVDHMKNPRLFHMLKELCSIKEKRLIICGFPGIGKTYCSEKFGIVDSDSSKHKTNWPHDYVDHIMSLDGVVLCSTHQEVRELLKEKGVTYICVIPAVDCKYEYVKRYEQRGSPGSFIHLLYNNWDKWIDAFENETCVYLHNGEYLSDKIQKILELS